MKIKPVDNVYFGAHLPPKQREIKMGYKIPDLKEDIKKALQDWSEERKGYTSDEVLDLHDIIDKYFKRIER